ncbi:MAG: hypothetical protein ACR2RL_08210 [Gammaproteobacteria bacterium]
MNRSGIFARFACAMALALAAGSATSQTAGEPSRPPEPAGESAAPMSNERLESLLRKIDPDVAGQAGFWRLEVGSTDVLVITDQGADRMRIVAGIAQASLLDREALYRIAQANFDSALDARYAIARGTLWSAFIHPLSPLDDEQLLSALAQVVTLAKTYGTTYSSGALTFGGGDSNELLEELRDRARAI